MRRFITVKLQHEGIHNWPSCNLEGVTFLKSPHRHIFHITAVKEVEHNDRQVEIILLKRKIRDHLDKNFGRHFGSLSCEDIAEYLTNIFKLSECEVLEDGENGAKVRIE